MISCSVAFKTFNISQFLKENLVTTSTKGGKYKRYNKSKSKSKKNKTHRKRKSRNLHRKKTNKKYKNKR